jgi:hypothetical protein
VLALSDVAGEVTGVQRIWLAENGKGKAPVAKPKRSWGRVKGSAMRLGNLDGSGVVTVCEGPEDGLSLCSMLGGAVWACGGLSFMPAMEFPPEVHSIIIGADNDPQGREGALAAARSFAERGLSVRIIYPLEGFKDFNAELLGVEPMTNPMFQERVNAAKPFDGWPDPLPLNDELLPVLPLALDMLPSQLAPWVQDIAERMNCPLDLVAIPAMVAAASLLGRRIGIRPQQRTTWLEVCNVWGRWWPIRDN